MSADSLEQRVAKLEEFAADVREYTRILTELIRRHDERMDEHDRAFGETDAKIAALADAQIQTEGSVRRLVEAQAHSDQRLDALIDIVRERREGKGDGEAGGD